MKAIFYEMKNFYRLRVPRLINKPFIKYRVHDVGRKGDLERIAGLGVDKKWYTVGWNISKKSVDLIRGKLVPRTQRSRSYLYKIVLDEPALRKYVNLEE